MRLIEIYTTLISASRDVKVYFRTHERLKDSLKARHVTGGRIRRNSSKTFIVIVKLVQRSISIEGLLDIFYSFDEFNVNGPPMSTFHLGR